MQPVQKISFKGENSNLLQSFANPVKQPAPVSVPPAAPQPAEVQIKSPAPQQDTFEKEGKKSFIKEYGGLTALAVSVIGIPVTYAVTRKANTKTLNKVQQALTEMSEKFSKLDIDSKIKTAVEETVKAANKKQAKELVSKKTNLTALLIGLGSGFGIGEFIKNNREKLKDSGLTDDEITDAGKLASEIVENPKSALKYASEARNLASSVHGKAESAVGIATDARNTVNSMDERINDAHNRANEALKATEVGLNPIMQMYTVRHYDLNLLQVLNYAKKIDQTRSDEALASVRDAANIRLDRSAEDTIRDIKNYKEVYPELTSTWSLTAEYAPIKTGGLGVVPVDLQNNFTKLGIDMPTFIPMYLKKNQSEFRKLPNHKFEYKYNGQKFDLTKLAETTTHVFRNGETKLEKIEYYMTELPVEGAPGKSKQLIFVKSGNYFNENIYDSTTNAEETERFALFTKAVYKLAKLKVNTALNTGEKAMSGVSDMEIFDQAAFDDLKAPNSMILNDWHAGSMAGLLRYRAPMEYNYREIPRNTFGALKDMPLLMIGHNLGCQGKSNDGAGSILSKNRVTENIINTLYDSYAIAITENAHSGIMGDNDDMCNTVLMKRCTADKHFNHLFNGVALSDWFVPVSKNYTNEIITDPKQSGILYPLLQRRKGTGTISGTVNGLDKDKVDMTAVSKKNFVKDLVLEKYDLNSDMNKIMKLRAENKKHFYQKYIKPVLIDKDYPNAPEIVRPDVGNMNISEDDFMNAPLISFAHRLTSQKGLLLMKGAIFRLFDNWDNLFPDKPMPYFIVGGPPESEEELQYLYDLKNPDYGTNKARLDHVIALKGNMPNPAIMSASTFFCAPSTYEPCGLTQGECFAKGTPIIATDTGGFHDTVVDGKTGFLAPYISEEAFYDKLVEALRMYYDKPEEYKHMVQNDLKIDFSWAQRGKKGPIYEYTDKLGFDRENFNDIAVSSAA